MQVSMTDVRAIGYRKLYRACAKETLTLEDLKQIGEDLERENLILAPYSFLNQWVKIPKVYKRKKIFKGIEGFVYLTAPLIDTIIDSVSKRRFRNMWESLWSEYADALGLSQSTGLLYSQVALGLMLGYIDNYNIPKFLYYQTNGILLWYLLTRQESTWVSQGKTSGDLLEYLVNTDVDKFVESLSKSEFLKMEG